MAKLMNTNFASLQKSNDIVFKQLNTNDYVLGKIQQNIQESFSDVTEKLNNLNLCFYEQNFGKNIALNTFFSFSNVISDIFGTYDSNTGIFKAPKDSKYFINCFLYLSITASQYSTITLYKNGIAYILAWGGDNISVLVRPQFNLCLDLKAGDELKLFWSSSDVNPVIFGNSTLVENQFVVRW